MFRMPFIAIDELTVVKKLGNSSFGADRLRAEITACIKSRISSKTV
jgi:hypothetical protein